MAALVLGEEWTCEFVRLANLGPDEERIAEVDENYWQWIEQKKQDLNLSLALVVVDPEEQVLRATILRLEEGIIVDASLESEILPSELKTAHLVLGGTEADWAELMHGPRSLSQNIMYRKLRLYRGDLHLFFRNIYFFVEMIRAGLRVTSA